MRSLIVRLKEQRLVSLALRVNDGVKEHDLAGAAGELAFRFFLAMFPFFIFLAAIGGFAAEVVGVKDPTNEIMDAVGDSLPPDAASVLRDQVDAVVNQRDLGLLSVGIVGTILAASSGIATIMKAMNRVQGVRETRPIWLRYAMAVGLTVAGGVLLVAAFILMVVGQVYGLDVARELGVEGAAAKLATFARWPAVILLALAATALLYWLAPCGKFPFRWLSPGSLLFVVCWLGASYVFGLYVSQLGSYNATYGTLGGVVVALVWFYITGLILFVGAELNAVLDEERRAATAEAQRTEADIRVAAGPGDVAEARLNSG